MKIKTQRCTIRPFRAQDIEAFMRYRNDEAWMRYQGFKGLTREEYDKALLCEPSFENGAQLAIIETDSGRLIGDLYLKKEDTAYWVGYTVGPAFARQGYATEALSALIAWLRWQGGSAIKAGVLAENTASIRLLNKLGFKHIGTNDFEEDVYLLP